MIPYAVAHCLLPIVRLVIPRYVVKVFEYKGPLNQNSIALEAKSVALQIKTSLSMGNGIGYHIMCLPGRRNGPESTKRSDFISWNLLMLSRII